MTRKSRWLPPQAGTRSRLSGNREPGADHDYMARLYPVGPAATPLGDVYSAIVLFAGALLWLFMPSILGAAGTAAVVISIAGAAAFAAGAAFTLQRGLRRWRWRKRNVDRTGGVYLKPWQRTPDAYRGGAR